MLQLGGHQRVFFEGNYIQLVTVIDRSNQTSKTPAGRSATFRVQGSGCFFLLLYSGAPNLFFGLICCTISSDIPEKNAQIHALGACKLFGDEW